VCAVGVRRETRPADWPLRTVLLSGNICHD